MITYSATLKTKQTKITRMFVRWHGQWRFIYLNTVPWAAGSSLLAELLPECIFWGAKMRLGTILTGRGLLPDGILIKCFLFAAHCSESWWLTALNHKAHLGVLQSITSSFFFSILGMHSVAGRSPTEATVVLKDSVTLRALLLWCIVYFYMLYRILLVILSNLQF